MTTGIARTVPGELGGLLSQPSYLGPRCNRVGGSPQYVRSGRGQQTPRRLMWTPEMYPRFLAVEQLLLSLLLEKETTEQMTSFMVNVSITCKVLRTGGSRVALWFLNVTSNGSLLPNCTYGLVMAPNALSFFSTV